MAVVTGKKISALAQKTSLVSTDKLVVTETTTSNKSITYANLLTQLQTDVGGQVLTTEGDVLTHDGANQVRLGIGANGQVLTSDGTTVSWQTPASGFVDPMTTEGDLIVNDNGGNPVRLGVGASNQFLRSDGTNPVWQSVDVIINPLTTNGDLLAQIGGVPARLPIGSNGQVLSVSGGALAWSTQAAGYSDPMTTRGDVVYRDSSNTTNRLAVGTANQVLTSDGTDVSWQDPASGFSSPLTTQGDIMYHNGSTEVRLAKGIANQVLAMNTSATAPLWVSGGSTNFTEEGTWTPTASGVSFSSEDGYYVKVGNMVYVTFVATMPVTADSTIFTMSGLPFTAKNVTDLTQVGLMETGTSSYRMNVIENTTNIGSVNDTSNPATVVRNSTFSGLTLAGSLTYIID